MNPTLIRCTCCGAKYPPEAAARLDLVRVNEDGDRRLERRACTCGNEVVVDAGLSTWARGVLIAESA